MQLQNPSPAVRLVKAGREQVFTAADEILRSGQRPTIEALQARLGGGSPNSIVAYLKDWYAELGGRFAVAEAPAEGLTLEVHRAALTLQHALQRLPAGGAAGESTETLIRSLRAEVVSQRVLLDEMRAQRGRDLQALADARSLLIKKDEDLQRLHGEQIDAMSRVSVLEHRLRARPTSKPAQRKIGRRKPSAARKTKATKARAKRASRPRSSAKRAKRPRQRPR